MSHNTVISYPISDIWGSGGRPEQGIYDLNVRDRIALLEPVRALNGAGSGITDILCSGLGPTAPTRAPYIPFINEGHN